MFTSIKKTIAVLDIGSSKIVSMVVRPLNKDFEIIGVGKVLSEGIKHGIITDVKLARSAIASAVYEAEKMSEQPIDKVTVNVSNSLTKSMLITIKTDFSGNQILPSDLKKLKEIAFRKVDLSKNEILVYKVLKHDLDEMKDIIDPEFMFANLLISYIHIVTIPIKYLINISSSLLGCQLKISNFMISSEASGISCLQDSETTAGCVLIDIGGGNADYVVYKEKKIIETGVVPLGGINITRDISEYFSITFEEAEKLKILHAGLKNVHPEEEKNVQIRTTNGNTSKQINKQMLNKVVMARVSEIIEFVMIRLREKKQHRACLSRIIFTGGTSKLNNLVPFIEEKYKVSARIGSPNNITIKNGFTEDPAFATVLGLIKSSVNKGNDYLGYETSKVKKALSWLKQNF